MSQPSRRKTSVASPERSRRDSGSTGMPSPARIFESALRAARGIHATDDPLQPEVLVSGLLGTLDRPLIDVADTVDFLGQRLVSYLVDKRSPDALALVHGIAALADEPLAASARQGILRLRTAGRADPAFAGRIGRYRFLEAWTSIDEFGDQEMVAASFADPADQAHALAFMIDHKFEGLVREAFLAPDLEGIRTTWAGTSGMAIVALDAQALADRLGQGLRMYDLYLDPPCSDDVRELAVLMKARLRALPPARELERPEVPDEERDELESQFLAAMRDPKRFGPAKSIVVEMMGRALESVDANPLTRCQWTMPPMSGSVRGIDAARLDPSDPDGRRMLIELDHPSCSPRLSVVIIPSRSTAPWSTRASTSSCTRSSSPSSGMGSRLKRGRQPSGSAPSAHDRHEILHGLAGVVAGVAWTGPHRGEPQDLNTDLQTALRALPSGRIDKGRRRSARSVRR